MTYSRSDRYLERGKDGLRVFQFSATAMANIFTAIGKGVKSLATRDKNERLAAGKDLREALGDILQGADSALSAVVGTTRETLGAVLEGKSRAIDKLNVDPRMGTTRFGKSRRHVSNRVINLLDGGLNVIGGGAIAGLDIIDVTAGKGVDKITSRSAPRAHEYGKKVGNALRENLIKEATVEGIRRGGVKGKSRRSSGKGFSYTKSTRDKK